MSDVLGFGGKRVLVTGCATGIGAATAALLVALGAEVHGLDRRAPDVALAGFETIDLGDPDAIAAVRFQGRLDILLNCVGLSPTQAPSDVVRVNFLGVRSLTERLLGAMAPGGAIVSVASNGGMGWRERRGDLSAFIATPSFEDGLAWFEQRRETIANPYAFSKEALVVWTLEQSRRLIAGGVRINCTSPGAVQTPMLEDIETKISTSAIDVVTKPIGRRSTAVEQAWPLLMLASDRAAYINGVDLAVDGGFAAATATRP